MGLDRALELAGGLGELLELEERGGSIEVRGVVFGPRGDCAVIGCEGLLGLARFECAVARLDVRILAGEEAPASEEWKHAHEHEQQDARADPLRRGHTHLHGPPISQSSPDDEQHEASEHEPATDVLWLPLEARLLLRALEPGDGLLHTLDPVAARLHREVVTTGRARDLPEPFFVEAHAHRLAIAALQVAGGISILVGERHERSLLRADGDGVDADVVSRGGLRRRKTTALRVLAIGDEQDHLPGLALASTRGRTVEQLLARVDGAAEVGAADGHVRGLEIAPEELRRLVVRRERVRQRLAGERDHADAVPLQLVEQAGDLGLRTLETRWIDVLREHRAREIEGDDEVEPTALREPRATRDLRPRERDRESRDRDDEAHGLQPSPRRGQRLHHLADRLQMTDTLEHAAASLAVERVGHDEQRHHDRAPEELRHSEAHGNRRKRVSDSAISRSKRASAGPTNIAYSST